MVSQAREYVSKELSAKTWPNLATLFGKPEIGDAWWCWCAFHHFSSYSTSENRPARTRAERVVRNRRQEEKLAENRRAHADVEPVGWYQYGPREELHELTTVAAIEISRLQTRR